VPKLDSSEVQIIDVDADSLAMMALEGKVCFHCRLLEDGDAPLLQPGGCPVRAEDIKPLVTDDRSGVKVVLHGSQIVGYAVFGPPRVFRNLDRLAFRVDDNALLIGALYVTREAEEASVDVDLLIDIMGFARGRGYELVQAVCRPDEAEGPEGTARLFDAAGFVLSDTAGGACLARTTLKEWDENEEQTEAGESGPAGISNGIGT
jgi:hypothetical protein